MANRYGTGPWLPRGCLQPRGRPLRVMQLGGTRTGVVRHYEHAGVHICWTIEVYEKLVGIT